MIRFNEENQRRAKLDWPGLCRYRADNASVLSRDRPGLESCSWAIPSTENWALADTTLFANGVVNRGISGQTTAQMLVKFAPT